MDLQAAQKEKAELEKKIAELLRVFSEETGLTVDRVNVNQTILHGKLTPVYWVETEVKL